MMTNRPFSWYIFLLGLWVLPWTGIALWKSARKGHKIWFIVILITNTVAILEILYIFIFSKKKKKETEKSLEAQEETEVKS